MTKSELVFTGNCYNLSAPDCGEEYVVVDYDKALKLMKDSFGDDVDNILGDDVEIATDNDGNFYAVAEPQSNGLQFFVKIENPDNATEGVAELLSKWEFFDEEEA